MVNLDHLSIWSSSFTHLGLAQACGQEDLWIFRIVCKYLGDGKLSTCKNLCNTLIRKFRAGKDGKGRR